MVKVKSSTVIMTIAIVLAGIVGVLSYQLIRTVTKSVPVVVANTEIPAFSKIDASQLKVEQVPVAAVKKGMLPKVELVAGHYTRTTIPADTYISTAMLSEHDLEKTLKETLKTQQKNPLAMRITDLNEPEKRAMTIPVTPVQGLGGKVIPGDKVDIIGALKLPLKGTGSAEPVSKPIASSALVLDVLGEPGKPIGVTLLLTEKQAQETIFALMMGQLHLSLVPYNSKTTTTTSDITTSASFVSEYVKPDMLAGQAQNK